MLFLTSSSNLNINIDSSALSWAELSAFLGTWGILIAIFLLIPTIGYYKAFTKARVANLLAFAGLLFPFFIDYGKAKAAKCMWPFWLEILAVPLFIVLGILPAINSESAALMGTSLAGIVGLFIACLVSRVVLMVKFIKAYTNTDNIFVILILVLLLTAGLADVSWLVGYMNCNYKG